MEPPGAKLTGKKAQAVAALLLYPNREEAAAATGISGVTLWRWTQEPEFAEAYRKARRQAVQHAIGRIQQVCSDAVRTLQDVMMEKDSPASSKVTAAKTILEMAIKAVELEDLEARIAALEERMMAR